MEKQDFQDYSIAAMSKEDVMSISALEKLLSDKCSKPIVLIAYEPKENRVQ